MCSMYWNLKDVAFTCPHCGEKDTDNLQTHFMGEPGSCVNYYSIGDRIPELGRTSVNLDGTNDSLIGSCSHCNEWIEFGALITKGRVKEVWPLPRNN